MKRGGLILLALATSVTVPLACQEPPGAAWSKCFSATEPARSELKAGVDSYKNARYEEAIAHFRRSVSLDSKLLQADLYLASALAQQFIPGVETPDNTGYAEQAIAAYSTVMQQGAQGSADQLNAIRASPRYISS